MKKIKNVFIIAILAVLSFSMVSCENENIDTPASVSEVNGLNASQVVNEGLIQTRARSEIPLYSGILNYSLINQHTTIDARNTYVIKATGDRHQYAHFYVKNLGTVPLLMEKYFVFNDGSIQYVASKTVPANMLEGSNAICLYPHMSVANLNYILYKVKGKNYHSYSIYCPIVWGVNFIN